MRAWPSRHHRLMAVLGVGAALLLTAALPAGALPAPAPAQAAAQPHLAAQPNLAAQLVFAAQPNLGAQPRLTAADTQCSAAFFHGDFRLGPARLPTAGHLGQILTGYHRLGGMTADAFLARFWLPAKHTWDYPPKEGYVLGVSGAAEKFVVLMTPGLRMDRFGKETGTFLSPYGQPFAIRALAPWSLDGTTCGYHAYLVRKDFLVDAGPVARWFRQPGYGFQYVLNPQLIPGAPASLDVSWLVSHGYLQRLR
jgi:hypothetical protein